MIEKGASWKDESTVNSTGWSSKDLGSVSSNHMLVYNFTAVCLLLLFQGIQHLHRDIHPGKTQMYVK